MPYLKGKLKGELTAPELRRMIKEHNKLMSITIPPKTDRDGLIKLINDNGYKINHEKQRLTINKVVRKPNIKLPPAPTPKTTEQKAQAKKQKDKKKIEDNLKLKMKVEKVKSKTTSANTSTQTETPMQESKPKQDNIESIKLNIRLGYDKKGLPINDKLNIIEVEKWFIKRGYNSFTDKQKKSIMNLIKEKNTDWAIKQSKGKTDLYSLIPITKGMGDDNNLGTFKIKKQVDEPEPKKPEPKKAPALIVDEEKWKEFLDIVEDNKEILLKKLRPDDKKNKNQYDYYMFKYKNRKKDKENPKRMIRLVNNKIK